MNPYKKKLDKVIGYIYAHVDEDLSLEQLAKVAGISPFHFHRIFTAVFNETLGEMIVRIRMEKAISKLIHGRYETVLEIALEVGFKNPSSFTRAFKRYFGFTPMAVVKKDSSLTSKISTLKSKYGKEISPASLYPVDITETQGEKAMQVTITKRPLTHVIGLEANYTHDSNMGAWLKLYKWYGENKGETVTSFKGLALCYDDPSITPMEKCRAKNCLIVNHSVSIQSPFIKETIPEGKYAVTTYVIKDEHKKEWGNPNFKAEDFHHFIQNFTKNWLVKSGHEVDHYPLMMIHHLKEEIPLHDINKEHNYFDITAIDLLLKLKT